MMSNMADKKCNELSSGEAALMLNENQTENSPTVATTRRHRCNILYAFLVAFVLLFVCMTVLYIVERHRKRDKPSVPDVAHRVGNDVCKTAECFETATDIMSSIDPKKDPCEDFYEYACNRWIEKHPVPKDAISVDHWSILTKEVNAFISKTIKNDDVKKRYENVSAVSKAFAFFDSCMNIKDKVPRINNPLATLIKKYLPWPIVDDNWNKTSVHLSRLIARVIRDFDSSPFFKVVVQSDLKNSTVNVINVQQTFDWGLFPHQLTRNFTGAIKSRAVYRDLVYNVSMLLGANNSEQLKKDVWEIFDLEMKLAKIGKGYSEFDEERYYGKYKIRELQERTKGLKIDWVVLFNEMLRDTKHQVTEDDEVIVTDIDVVVKMIENSLGSISDRAILNYIGWRVIMEIYRYTSQQLDDLRINFRIKGWNLLAFNKEDNCKHMMQENFALAMSRIFVDEKFPRKSKELAKELAESIQKVFQETLRNSEWMDDKSKQAAIEKADAVKGNYGYPDFIRDDAKFDAKMKLITVSKDSFLDTMFSIKKNNKRNELLKVGKPIDRNAWTESPLLVNPYYLPTSNTINFQAAFLQPPFYDSKYLRAVSYGGVGAIIAHELIHGFDTSGKNFDKDGNNIQWWTESTLARYNNRTRCLVDQYNGYTFEGFPVNGEMTLSENIGDNVGLRESFKAYQQWLKTNGEEPSLPGIFTNEQIFFLSYARNWCKSLSPIAYETEVFMAEHAPSPFRVNGPLQNFPEFSTAFSCPSGSKMNPKKKCGTW